MGLNFNLMLEDTLHIEENCYFDRIFYLFDTHRTSFLCWIKALQEGMIGKNNNLVTIDLHLDFIITGLNKKHINLAKTLDIKKIRDNIKLNNKQDWIIMGMETGIIKDATIISPTVNLKTEGITKSNQYIDTSGNIHKVIYFESLEDFEKNSNKICSKPLLDIDLDYFNRKYFKELKKIKEKDIVKYFKPKSKLYQVFSKSKIVTLAAERRYTGEKGFKWGRNLIDLFLKLVEFSKGGRNPFDTIEYNESLIEEY